MSTFFEQLPKSYADVQTAPGIDTTTFLQASEGLVLLFDQLGSAAFKPVTSDLSNNIAKIRTREMAAIDKCKTLEDLVQNEGADDKKRTATQALLWLTRGLQFTALAMRRSLDNPSEELSESFTQAYAGSLKQFHSFVVKPIFTMAMKACPYRKDFFAKLGSPQDVVLQQMSVWLAALEAIVKQIMAFIEPYSKGL